MPGGKVAKGARSSLPPKALRQFRHIRDSMEKHGVSPAGANKGAWSKVHERYAPPKSGHGKWHRKK
jgi:cation transport regulator ChaB